MTVRSFQRGWPIVYDRGWAYENNGESIETERPCRRCGRMPTPEGHDACLGEVPGVTSACCGHGVEPPYSKSVEPSCQV